MQREAKWGQISSAWGSLNTTWWSERLSSCTGLWLLERSWGLIQPLLLCYVVILYVFLIAECWLCMSQEEYWKRSSLHEETISFVGGSVRVILSVVHPSVLSLSHTHSHVLSHKQKARQVARTWVQVCCCDLCHRYAARIYFPLSPPSFCQNGHKDLCDIFNGYTWIRVVIVLFEMKNLPCVYCSVYLLWRKRLQDFH